MCCSGELQEEDDVYSLNLRPPLPTLKWGMIVKCMYIIADIFPQVNQQVFF